jgi:hypothetical protein|tara:strand:- start:581 stop:772 length:192 start_codon:yes stop_codon:yes gene_type:complete
MKILHFFQYLYLFFAVLFIYDGFVSWGEEGNRSIISFVFAALAIFMFFFRKKFRNKFGNRNGS